MSNSKNDKAQFKRYLSGEMDSKESHAFERSALSDPFEQEALEGLEQLDSEKAFADIEKLQRRVLSGRRFSITTVQMAAAVAILLVGSITTYLLTRDQQSTEGQDAIALEELPVEIEASEPEESFFTADSSFDTLEIALDETNEQLAVSTEQTTTNESQARKATSTEETRLESVAISTEPLETSGLGIAGNIDVAPSALDAATVGEDSAIAEGEDVTDALAAEETVLAETVVEEADSKAKRAAGAASRAATPADQALEDAPAQPGIGDEAYQRYLRENLRYPAEAIENEVEGEVRLRLSISSSGEIINIKIRKSLSDACDAEAIRLVQEGPQWSPEIKNGEAQFSRVNLTVEFKR